MKKCICTLLILSMAVTAAGCSASEQQMLGAYTASGSDSASSLVAASAADGFSSDLSVISRDEASAGYGAAAADDFDAAEVFLTGTDDNKVLAASGIYKTMPPASLTKILTALTALKYADDKLDQEFTLTDQVTVSVSGAQVCGYEPGDVVTLRTLLYSMLIYSGNDAANAVACAVSGDISSFCEKMNAEAASLGATHTHFVTPNGLDQADHYSTAYDLYLIFRECLKYDLFKDAISHSSYTASFKRDGQTMSLQFPTTNYYLLGQKTPPEGVTVVGGKTGTTDDAGLCLILYSTDKDGKGYISVLLGCPDKDTLYNSMTNLLSNISK